MLVVHRCRCEVWTMNERRTRRSGPSTVVRMENQMNRGNMTNRETTDNKWSKWWNMLEHLYHLKQGFNQYNTHIFSFKKLPDELCHESPFSSSLSTVLPLVFINVYKCLNSRHKKVFLVRICKKSPKKDSFFNFHVAYNVKSCIWRYTITWRKDYL